MEQLSCAALASPTRARFCSLQPPLPGEALDRPREYWVRAAFSCGSASSQDLVNILA